MTSSDPAASDPALHPTADQPKPDIPLRRDLPIYEPPRRELLDEQHDALVNDKHVDPEDSPPQGTTP
jgi:hypothetical protein